MNVLSPGAQVFRLPTSMVIYTCLPVNQSQRTFYIKPKTNMHTLLGAMLRQFSSKAQGYQNF